LNGSKVEYDKISHVQIANKNTFKPL